MSRWPTRSKGTLPNPAQEPLAIDPEVFGSVGHQTTEPGSVCAEGPRRDLDATLVTSWSFEDRRVNTSPDFLIL